MAMALIGTVLAGCAAEPPRDAAAGPALLANEAAAVTRDCIATGFDPAATAARLRERGYARPSLLSPMLARSADGVRIAVPAAGPCAVVTDAAYVRLVRGAMRNALRAEGFARDRDTTEAEVWVGAGLRLALSRESRMGQRYQPSEAALRLTPLI
jgi:hypothetical protein